MNGSVSEQTTGFAFIEQGLDGQRDSTLHENGQCLTDFSVGSGPLGTKSENLFELIQAFPGIRLDRRGCASKLALSCS
jgi:hypothetical protein